MIFSEMSGGLGNQLFQYAAGRAVGLRLGAPVRMDVCWYRNNPLRAILLDRFNIQATFATRWESAILQRWEKFVVPVQKYIPVPNLTIIRDFRQENDDRLREVEGNVFLKGHWESEGYFALAAHQIREDLTFKSEPDEENRLVLEQIQASEAVCLHVRRGDIVHALSVEYYRTALEILQGRVRQPHFFIFSDDAAWTRENIKLEFPATYVTHNVGKRDYEDLRLMTYCKHFIIANSTFSWWGAWLSRNPGKQILSPKKWFKKRTTPGLLPAEWTLIEAAHE
jgi:hypothetical protein